MRYSTSQQGDNFIVLDKDTGVYYEVNASGAEIFGLLNSMTPAQANSEIKQRHGLQEDLVLHFLEDIGKTSDAILESTFPSKIQWRVTNRCNLRCRHCYTEGGVKVADELSTGELLAGIDYVKSRGSLEIIITGGEPFVRSDLPQILDRLERSGMYYCVFTNATLIGENRDWLAEAPPVRFFVSIEGPREFHDSVRGQGMFDTTVEGIRLLKSLGHKVSVNITLTRGNKGLLGEIIPFLVKELRVDGIQFGRFMPVGRGGEERDWLMGPKDYLDAIHGLDALSAEMGMPFSYDSAITDGGKRTKCAAGIFRVTVMPGGDIYPCQMYPEAKYCMGDIREHALHDVWKTPARLRFQDDTTVEACEGCEHYKFCVYGCRAYLEAVRGICGRGKLFGQRPDSLKRA